MTIAANPITADLSGAPERPIRFRRAFDVADGLVSAELLVTALGIYQAECNGTVVGDEVLAPGWTSYDHRILIQRLGEGKWDVYGQHIGPIAELHLTYGHDVEIIPTDTSWRASFGPITFAGLYDGEHADAGLETSGWSCADFNATGWQEVAELPSMTERLADPIGPRCAVPKNCRWPM